MDAQQADLNLNDPSLTMEEREAWREVRAARADIDLVIDELQTRLSPSHLAEEAMSTVKHKTQDLFNEAGTVAADFAREHPVPLAILGIGAAWLATEVIRGGQKVSHQTRAYAHGDPRFEYEDQSTGAIDKVKSVAETAKAKVGDAAESVKEGASRLYSSAREQGRDAIVTAKDAAHGAIDRTTDAVGEAYDNHPLLFMTAAVGAGVALGIALPSTRREDRWMGQYRDDVVQRAGRLGREAAERGEAVASEAFSVARDEAEEHAEEMKETVAQQAKEAATNAKRDAEEAIDNKAKSKATTSNAHSSGVKVG